MSKKNSITQEHIDRLFSEADIERMSLFGKTRIVVARLKNGFVIVESSSCVDPVNFDESIGDQICESRIKDKLWEFEGYKLQSDLDI